jgi:hypothetical protein
MTEIRSQIGLWAFTAQGAAEAVRLYFQPLHSFKAWLGRLIQNRVEATASERPSRNTVRRAKELLSVLHLQIGTVPRQLLFLQLSTTFSEAVQHLDSLAHMVAQAPATQNVDISSVLDTLEQSVYLRLWHPPLENPTASHKPERELVAQAIKAYVALIPHMSDEQKQRAIQFCAQSVDAGSWDLKIEAARTLLPRLLVASKGQESLIETYKHLLRQLRTLQNDEERRLLSAIIAGFQIATAVDSPHVVPIWLQAFRTAMANLNWAWEKAHVGQIWCIAMKNRLRYSGREERETLASEVRQYLTKEDAPSHSFSYVEIARLFHTITQSFAENPRPFRFPDRAVVPQVEKVNVQITFPGDTPIVAQLVNFSLYDSDLRVTGRGAWAEALGSARLLPVEYWREATVTVSILQERQVLFKQAKVLGPIEMRRGIHYYGFRILLGPAFPESSILPLKNRWDIWVKR